MLNYTIWKPTLCFIITWMYGTNECGITSLSFLMRFKTWLSKLRRHKKFNNIKYFLFKEKQLLYWNIDLNLFIRQRLVFGRITTHATWQTDTLRYLPIEATQGTDSHIISVQLDIYHPMDVLPYDVCCWLYNLFFVQFIVPTIIEGPTIVLMGCEHGFLGTYTLGFQSSLCNCTWLVFTSTEIWIESKKFQWSCHGWK